MIQRIQTLYLILTTVLPLLFLKLKLLKFTDKDGMEYSMGLKGIYSSGPDQVLSCIKQLLPISLLIILISSISLFTIFMFRKRKLQRRMSLFIIMISAGLIVAEIGYSVMIIREMRAKIIPGFTMVVPVLTLIFAILAYRGINKDEDLVKSYDRLR